MPINASENAYTNAGENACANISKNIYKNSMNASKNITIKLIKKPQVCKRKILLKSLDLLTST